VIPARSERGWQSESDGIAQGTEGWVKYNRAVPAEVVPGGPPVPPQLTDEVYIYWTNPFLGGLTGDLFTRSKSIVSVSGTTPDCDAPGGSSGGSGFAPPPSQFQTIGQTLDPNHPESTNVCVARPLDGSEGNTLTVLGVTYLGIPIAPIVFFGDLSIIAHAWARYAFKQCGSLRQCLFLGDDPTKGFRRFQPPGSTISLRQLFHL